MMINVGRGSGPLIAVTQEYNLFAVNKAGEKYCRWGLGRKRDCGSVEPGCGSES